MGAAEKKKKKTVSFNLKGNENFRVLKYLDKNLVWQRKSDFSNDELLQLIKERDLAVPPCNIIISNGGWKCDTCFKRWSELKNKCGFCKRARINAKKRKFHDVEVPE